MNKRTNALRRLYEEVLNDSNSRLRSGAKQKSFDDFFYDTERSSLFREALQHHFNFGKAGKSINTHECNTGLRKLITTCKVKRKNRQSQYYNKIKRFSSTISAEESQLKVKDELQEKITQNEITPDITDEIDTKSKNSWRYNTEKEKQISSSKRLINSLNPHKDINSAPFDTKNVKTKTRVFKQKYTFRSRQNPNKNVANFPNTLENNEGVWSFNSNMGKLIQISKLVLNDSNVWISSSKKSSIINFD